MFLYLSCTVFIFSCTFSIGALCCVHSTFWLINRFALTASLIFPSSLAHCPSLSLSRARARVLPAAYLPGAMLHFFSSRGCWLAVKRTSKKSNKKQIKTELSSSLSLSLFLKVPSVSLCVWMSGARTYPRSHIFFFFFSRVEVRGVALQPTLFFLFAGWWFELIFHHFVWLLEKRIHRRRRRRRRTHTHTNSVGFRGNSRGSNFFFFLVIGKTRWHTTPLWLQGAPELMTDDGDEDDHDLRVIYFLIRVRFVLFFYYFCKPCLRTR